MAQMNWSTWSGKAPASYEEFFVPAMVASFAERLVGVNVALDRA